jgi:hypothetical protein
MLDLARFETFCSRLTIKPRERTERDDIASDEEGLAPAPKKYNSSVVPFIFNPSQKKIMHKLHERRREKKPMWLIFLKARRLGVSTFSTALATAHCLQKASASALLVAQLTKTAKAMFDEAKNFSECLPMRLPVPTQHELYFPHSGGQSVLSRATAKTVIGGRGLTLSFLHMTEAAFYPGEDSFVSLLNTISSADMDNIVVIETTANGVEGPGEAYYDYWTDAVEGKNDFMPIFLPWYEDPITFLPDDMALDAPADDYEKWLMRDFKCTKGQIAWHRKTIATKCRGSIYRWKAEYPSSPDEAFVASGDPIFEFDELEYMRRSCCNPQSVGHILGSRNSPRFEEMRGGPLRVWETPQPLCHYFIGVDAAKGVEDGDFASAVGWNAETGEQAFTYADRVGPEALSEKVNFLGKWYNKAMVNVELTGGWGYQVMKDLRDRYHYPNQYLWRSRDDKPDTKGRQAYGWETTDRSRQMLFTVFRKSVRASLPRDYGDGELVTTPEVVVKDIQLYSQASKAQSDIGWRWRVLKGHDDILMAGWLGWVANIQYHIPHPDLRKIGNTMSDSPSLGLSYDDSPESTAAGIIGYSSTEHYNRIMNWSTTQKSRDRLRGI